MHVTEIAVLAEYGLTGQALKATEFGNGLINSTWRVESDRGDYILQKVNTAVFKDPMAIDANIAMIAAFVAKHHPDYFFVAPVVLPNGKTILQKDDNSFYRLTPFVKGSHSKNVADTPGDAYEAAKQFGKFTHLLNGIDVQKIKVTIPSFHDLSLRYVQFLHAIKHGNPQRIKESASLIKQLESLAYVTATYDKICKDPAFKLRVTHHDTKISNVLFNDSGNAICVIDLDTVMPGYFISDVGDMMRTYLAPVSEEENDFDKIEVRDDFYRAIEEGYQEDMKQDLSVAERKHFFYAGVFMIYMQAIRFLTDHLNNDVYYGARYAGHNFVRAGNQLTLLQRLLEKEELLAGKKMLA